MQRIVDKFKELKKKKEKAFIAYIPFGFPKIKDTKDIILALQDGGADIIELGVPFSDPLADGPIIQGATALALRGGANLDKLFLLLGKMKSKIKVPLVIMTYYNPVFRFGMIKFFKKMAQVGVSGIMIVDLPIEESKDYIALSKKYNLESVFFVTPTTTKNRAKAIAKASHGFIYYISVTGITGPRSLSFGSLASHVKYLKQISKIPVCVGFGIHNKAQVAKVSSFSDGAIVGSSIIKLIANNYKKKRFLNILKQYGKSLKACTK